MGGANVSFRRQLRALHWPHANDKVNTCNPRGKHLTLAANADEYLVGSMMLGA